MVTIIISRACAAETGGGMWAAGQTVSASDTYAKVLIGRGDAYDPSGSLVDIGAALDAEGYLLASDGSALMLAETVTQTSELTATGLAYTGPGYYAGLNVTAYSGGPQTVTVRDSLDDAGAVLAVVTVSGTGVYPFAATSSLRIAFDVGLHLTITGGTSRTLTALIEALG